MEVLCIGRELNISTIFGTMAGSWIVVAVAVSFLVKDRIILSRNPRFSLKPYGFWISWAETWGIVDNQ